MLKWLNETDWFYTSEEMRRRQHHPGGFFAQLSMIFSHFKVIKIFYLASLPHAYLYFMLLLRIILNSERSSEFNHVGKNGDKSYLS